MVHFTLHGIGKPEHPLEPGEERVWLSITTFESILEEIKSQRDVVLTVDDANRSDIEIVLPALLRQRMKAIFFIPVGRLGSGGYLNRSHVRDLAESGMIVGSHGMYHRNWRQLSDAELREEIHASKETLEEIVNDSIVRAACPYGEYDRRVLRYLRDSEFQKVYTSDRGFTLPGAWLQPRNSICCHDTPQSVRSITSEHSTTKRLIQRMKRLIKRLR